MSIGNVMTQDGQNRLINVGGAILTLDATGTPITSPVTSGSANAIITLTIPANVAEITFSASEELYYSEDATFASYQILNEEKEKTIGVGKMTSFSFKCPTASTVIYFSFTTI